MRQFKKFIEMLNKIQVNNPFCEAFERMPIYEKFMREILSRKKNLKYDENIALEEECDTII